MKLHDLTPGSKEWLAARKRWRSASLASAMMGEYPYTTRTALLVQFATGKTPEVSAMTQKVFNQGHESEEEMRPVIEALYGIDLKPQTVTDDDEWMSATLDGWYRGHNGIVWEHKQYNKQKIAYMASTGLIPKQDYWQCVHQMAVTGSEKLIYTCGNPDDYEVVELEYPTDDVPKVIQGWKQFDEDLKSFTPPEEEAKGEVLVDPPVLAIKAEGRVLSSNVASFASLVKSEIDQINTDLQTPQDYADATEAVKWCKGVEDAIRAGKEAVLAQTASINDLLKELDEIAAHARRMRLYLDREVKAKKDEKRDGIIDQAVADIEAHCAALQVEPPINFRAQVENEMKGKRKLESLIDAADKVLTKAKLDATETHMRRGKTADWVLDIRIVMTRPAGEKEADVLLRAQEAFRDFGTVIGINTVKEKEAA